MERVLELTTVPARVTAGAAVLHGDLTVPAGAHGIVLFAHGSGSSRRSSRNQFVARALERRGLATFLVDLLTPDEEQIDQERAESALVQFRGDEPISGTMPAAAAAVREQDHALGVLGDNQIAFDASASRFNAHGFVDRWMRY